MEANRPLVKRRSSALEDERDAVEKQVKEDHERARRKRSSYLPDSSSGRLRDAMKAIQVASYIQECACASDGPVD